MPEFIVYQADLQTQKYEAGGRRILQTTKQIEEAEKQLARSNKNLQDSLGPAPMAGFGHMARPSVTSTTDGGRKVATVGNMSWLVREPDAPATSAPAAAKGKPGFFDAIRGQIEANQKAPADWGKLRSDVTHALGSIRPHFDFSSAKKDASEFADFLKEGAQSALSSLSPLKAIGTSMAAMAAAGAATGLSLMNQAADFDSLRMSLDSVEGSAKKSKDELKNLKQIAKAPGIGFEESVGAYTGLRNAGYDQKFSEEIEKQFANANARSGGGAESFGRIMLQLRQAAGREYLSQEDLTPIGEAGIPVNSILKKLYGTGDTEELKAKGVTADKAIHDLVAELAKLPRVAGGAKNVFDNVGDAVKFAAVAAGDGLNSGLLPYLNDLSATVEKMTDSGEIQAAFETAAINIAGIFGDTEDSMDTSVQGLLVAVDDLTAATRNFTINAEGVWDIAAKAWDLLNPVSPVYNAAKKLFGFGDDDLQSEHDRNAHDADARSNVRKSREGWKRAKDAGYKGGYTEWDGLSPEDKKKWLDQADKADKAKGGLKEPAKPNEQDKTKATDAQERTAKATEQLVALKKRQIDMDSATMGGGELARMGITATELNPGSPHGMDEATRLIYRAMEMAGGVMVARRHTGRTRNDSRGLY